MSPATLRLFGIIPLLLAAAAAQDSAQGASACNLEDGKQVVVRFNHVSPKNEKAVNGKPFVPAGTPITLFTEAQLTLAGTTIPVGAYSVYPIPGRDRWTLAVNKNVTAGAPYDEKQDLARASMETAPIDVPQDLDVAFGHVGSKCTLRIYFAKVGAFADFTEK
jgi:hypothetical protein